MRPPPTFPLLALLTLLALLLSPTHSLPSRSFTVSSRRSSYSDLIAKQAAHKFRGGSDFNDRYDGQGYDEGSYDEGQYNAQPASHPSSSPLISAVSKGSISCLFFLLMWRSVHHYESSDSRLLLVLPSALLFLGNLYGFVTSLMKGEKGKLKLLLNLNKLTEGILLISSFFKLIFYTPKRIYGRPLITKEILVGRVLVNALYLTLCQGMTKISVWGVEQSAGAQGYDSYNQGYEGGAGGYEDYGQGGAMSREVSEQGESMKALRCT
ncbi:hypothetical protein TL16_g03661 [Triparma laevis f. inornata]|uniref:Uncharacterized protein n=1 Tax=Triparma laevis f. inornata TaxID=1714386 RepID=A0A9W7A0B4_9STRA|nr:hypothetical protein TL16_g03661 [Triparma laevis f. inornata]